ncbi:AhpC/TSA family protein [Marinilabiliaceae bacterium JC017]|nr:AhpC/TSA family protein [Marinilabiliaceae bacterium JC017]
MKKILILGGLATLFACNQKQSITIKGKIENPASDIVTLYNPTLDKTDTLSFNQEDGTFMAEFPLEKDYFVRIINGETAVPLYIEPGNDLVLNFDVKALNENQENPATISGHGSENSSFLWKLNEINIEEGMRTLLTKPATSFDSLVQDNYAKKTKAIEEIKNKPAYSTTFLDKISLITKIEMAEKYHYYNIYHPRFAPQDTTPIPDRFNEYGKDIPLDNAAYFNEIRQYKGHVMRTYRQQIDDKLKGLNIDRFSINYTNRNFDEIIALNAAQEIKDELGKWLISSYSYRADSIKEIIEKRYTEVLRNEKYLQEFEQMLKTINSLQPGTTAPAFAYPDMEGNMVTSKDLAGKVIYIDVWATGCGPCRQELPHLKELEEQLHDQQVAFVSISVDRNKEAWEKLIKEKEMKGYQLHAPGGWNAQIVKDYAIQGIPRFILIDKEGKLVDPNTTRPSNPETKEKILKLLNS